MRSIPRSTAVNAARLNRVEISPIAQPDTLLRGLRKAASPRVRVAYGYGDVTVS